MKATDNATEKPDDGDEADNEEESDDDEFNDADDDESERPEVFDAENASDTAMEPRVLYHNDKSTAGATQPAAGRHHVPPLPDGSDDESYSTVNKNDPTHEQYENEQRQPTRKDLPVPEVHSLPKVARATNSNQKERPSKDIMDIHERLYTKYVPNYAARISENAMAIDPTNSPNRHNPNSQDTDSSAWTVQTGSHRTPAES